MVRGAVCFNTQPPEGGCACPALKAGAWMGFNTQPPEGGCPSSTAAPAGHCGFQHTAARRRLPTGLIDRISTVDVSTHSRPKAAAHAHPPARGHGRRFNTQPPEGGCLVSRRITVASGVSTHSRPKAAAPVTSIAICKTVFQHTAARRRLRHLPPPRRRNCKFQHTAARRRLRQEGDFFAIWTVVSTHSRPKAAAPRKPGKPPRWMFQHTAARRRLPVLSNVAGGEFKFQHTAARRRLRKPCPCPPSPPRFQHTAARRRLRQPNPQQYERDQFQHTAARRRLPDHTVIVTGPDLVSTHSRPKAAA